MTKEEKTKHKKHGFGGGSSPIDPAKGEGLGGFRADTLDEATQAATVPAPPEEASA